MLISSLLVKIKGTDFYDRGGIQMSEFSDKCKELINESRTNIYRISQTTGLERTALQRMVNGTRVPNPEFVKEFCSVLQISKIEERKLLELYEIAKDGKDVYQQRKIIMELVGNLHRNHHINWVEQERFLPPKDPHLDQKEFHALCSQRELLWAAQELIKEELKTETESYVSMNYSPLSEHVLEVILHLSNNSHQKIRVNQYVNFVKKENQDNININNLNFFKSIVPFAFIFVKEFYVYYSYVSKKKEDQHYEVWPYYIVTKNHVLLFSESMQSGFLYYGKDAATIYTKEIERMQENYRLLFSPQTTGNEPFLNYVDFVHKNTKFKSYVLESHPCFTYMIQKDWDMIQIRDIIDKERQSLFLDMSTLVYNESANTTSYFALNEMEHFMETGEFPGIYKFALCNVEKMENRKKLLLHFTEAIKNNVYNGRLLNQTLIVISTGLNIEVCENNGLSILSTSEEFPFNMLFIEELEIIETFLHFMQYLGASDMVYTKEETVEQLEGFLSQY